MKVVLKTDDDLRVLTAFRLCGSGQTTSNHHETAPQARKHFQSCKWCQAYVAQKNQSKQYSMSEVGWWSGYADRERA